MKTTNTKDIMGAERSYTAADGKTKYKYEKVGNLIEWDDGRYSITLFSFVNIEALSKLRNGVKECWLTVFGDKEDLSGSRNVRAMDIKVVESTYQKDGETKRLYTTVGKLIHKENGDISIKIYPFVNVQALLNDKGECWLNVFEQLNKNNSGIASTSNAGNVGLISDDVPF